MLRPSVVCTECIVTKQCVLEQKLLLRAYVVYEKSIGTKMNDLRLGHINHCVTFDVEYLGKNRKWPMGYQNDHVTDDVT